MPRHTSSAPVRAQPPPGTRSAVLTAYAGALEGAAAGAERAFRRAAELRHARPLHPQGVVVAATLHRHGAARSWGVPWIDEPGEETGTARLSRAVGLPASWPDVLGLALQIEDVGGERHDLLLSSTGTLPVLRHTLRPGRDVRKASYTSIVPFKAPRGLGSIGAFPLPGPALPCAPEALALELARRPLELRLAVASPGAPWEPFALLRLGPNVLGSPDDPGSFDPVLRPLAGMPMPGWLAVLRAGAYRGARAGRHAPDADESGDLR